jgi:hypothetical protein
MDVGAGLRESARYVVSFTLLSSTADILPSQDFDENTLTLDLNHDPNLESPTLFKSNSQGATILHSRVTPLTS